MQHNIEHTGPAMHAVHTMQAHQQLTFLLEIAEQRIQKLFSLLVTIIL